MEYNLKLSEKATKKILLNHGFRISGNDEYSLSKFVFKNIVYIVFKIDLQNMEMDWVVKDKNTNGLYIPFYNFHCGNNHFPVLKVRNEFGKIVQELTEKGILEEIS